MSSYSLLVSFISFMTSCLGTRELLLLSRKGSRKGDEASPPCRLARILEHALGTEVARCPLGTVCPASSETPALLCWGSLCGVERGSLGLEEDAAAARGREWLTNQPPLGQQPPF